MTSIYWNGDVSFPGRMHRLLYFRAEMHEDEIPRDFPVRVSVVSMDLEEPLSATFDLVMPDQLGFDVDWSVER